MKKFIILSAIAFGGLAYNTADAQIRVGVNLGFGGQQPAVVANPAFGNGDDYYYLPDLGVYYDVTDQCYVYFNGTEWIFSATLPGQYADFDWTSARRFEVRAFRPYLHDDFYRDRYNGNRVADWSRANYNNHFNNGYAGRGIAGDNRPYNRQADNRAYANQTISRVNDGFNQQAANRGFNRPTQPYRPNGQNFDNRGTEKPQTQNQDRGADNRGGTEHFAQNHGQNNTVNRKVSKF